MSASLSSFPANKVVGHHAYSAGGRDVNNQTVPVYTPALAQPGAPVVVIGWQVITSTEPYASGHEARAETVVKLAVLPGFNPGLRDVIDVPDIGQCDVVGLPATCEGNPFDWNPGSIVTLRRVTG